MGDTRRETTVCRDCTSAAPAVMASWHFSGVAPWPPAPERVTVNISTAALTVTNNVSMFSVSGAALHAVGGPNSNDYGSTLLLTMGSELPAGILYTKIFIIYSLKYTKFGNNLNIFQS